MTNRFLVLLTLTAMLFSVRQAEAQTIDFDKSFEDFFDFYAHKKDTTFTITVDNSDRTIKRFSLHTNLVDWMLTMPNFGVEFDLDKTKLNNRSLLLKVKYNGNTKHDVAPKFVFNKAMAHLEFRKYWRTGNKSHKNEYHSYKMLDLRMPDTLYREKETVNEFGEKEYQWEVYFSKKDSAHIGTYSGDKNRSKMYNKYHNVRRFLSGRTITNPRNWRAYYLGAFLSYDNYSYCFGKRGEQGYNFAAGATMGWSIPLIAAAFPREGGLDLDLGFNIGIPVGKYDGYKYVDATYTSDAKGNPVFHKPYYQTVPEHSSTKFTVCPKYIVNDVHVSLVYRFRSIARKVDLDLVDLYQQKEIDAFNDKATALENAITQSLAAASARKDSLAEVDKFKSDSAQWADNRIKARLLAMLDLDPDTTQFHGQDSVDYIRLILGKDTTEYRAIKRAQEKEAARLAKLLADSTARAQRAAAKDSARQAKVLADSIARDSIRAAKDSIRAYKDSLRRDKQKLDSLKRDSLNAVNDSIKGVRRAAQAEKDSIADAEKKARADAKKAQKKAEDEQKARERKAREEEEWIRNAPKRAQDSIEALKRDSTKQAKLKRQADARAEEIIKENEQRKSKLDKTVEKREKEKAKGGSKSSGSSEGSATASETDDEDRAAQDKAKRQADVERKQREREEAAANKEAEKQAAKAEKEAAKAEAARKKEEAKAEAARKKEEAKAKKAEEKAKKEE